MLKAKELGLELDGPQLSEVVEQLKLLEHEGYHFEVADGSLELLMRRIGGWRPDWFDVESFRVITDDRRGVDTLTGETQATVMTEATVKLHVEGERHIATEEGNGPVNALDRAVRSALDGRFPALERVHLTDYKVRVLDTNKGTGAVTRVLIDSTDGDAHLDDDRRQREHHRSVLAGAARFDPLRPAARPGQPSSVRGVPTDPFVPADPADLPRQQQNLPPGTALPPARRWRSDRPGDLESASPQGGLFGNPGPNVGFAYTLAEHVVDRIALAEHEDIHDVIPVIAEIAGRRAALLRPRARDPRRRGRDEHPRLRRQRGSGLRPCPRAARARSRALVLPAASDRRSGSRSAAAPAAR